MDAPFDSMKTSGHPDSRWTPEDESLRSLYDEDLRWLAGSVQGRRVLGRLMFDDCSLTDVASNPVEAGHREVACVWLARLQRVCPDALPTIWAERLELLRTMEPKTP